MQENNKFYKRVNRFSNRVSYIEEKYDLFDFNDNLKSDKIEELKFTNFLSSDKCTKYFLLLDICQKLHENYNNINKFFVPDEFDPSKYNSKRVFDIMNIVNNKQINRTEIIYKFKCKKDSEIQFYVLRKNNSLKLCLIDIYHIVIEAVNQKIGKANRIAIYNSRKKCDYDIKNINEQLNNNSDKP